MSRRAKYDLTDVLRIIGARDDEFLWFSAYSRSIGSVIGVYAQSGHPKTIAFAKEFILSGISTLKSKNFVESTIQWSDAKCIADVYGIILDGRPWYIKFLIDNSGALEIISFHPPKMTLTTVAGLVIWEQKNVKN